MESNLQGQSSSFVGYSRKRRRCWGGGISREWFVRPSITREEPDIGLIQLRRTDIDVIEVIISESIEGQGAADQDDFIYDDIDEDETMAVYDSEGSINSDDSDDMKAVEENEHITDDSDGNDNL